MKTTQPGHLTNIIPTQQLEKAGVICRQTRRKIAEHQTYFTNKPDEFREQTRRDS